MLLEKAKLANIEVLISKVYIIHMDITHHGFFSVRNGLREHNKIKEQLKNPQNAVEYII